MQNVFQNVQAASISK